LDEIYERIARCAKTIEAHQTQSVNVNVTVLSAPGGLFDVREEFNGSVQIQNKRVKWLILSDSTRVREKFRGLLGENVLQFIMVRGRASAYSYEGN